MSRSEAGGPGRAAVQGSEVDGSQTGTPKGTAAGSEAAELKAGPEGNLDGGAGHINLGSVPSKQDQGASNGWASEVCFPDDHTPEGSASYLLVLQGMHVLGCKLWTSRLDDETTCSKGVPCWLLRSRSACAMDRMLVAESLSTLLPRQTVPRSQHGWVRSRRQTGLRSSGWSARPFPCCSGSCAWSRRRSRRRA